MAMTFLRHSLAFAPFAALALVAATPGAAQQARIPAGEAVSPVTSSYADVARFAADAPLIIDARIRRADALPDGAVPGLPPQLIRLAVEADVATLIFGNESVGTRIAYLVDVPRDARGRAPRLKRQRVLLFANAGVTGGRLQLVAPDAQLAWDPARDATVHAIAAERAAGPTPPRITGVGQAFYVPGTIEGESETQIFLRTATGDPVSLTILSRPGQPQRWAVAFGEIVDESAKTPHARTLGWYRLACGLPDRLPAASVAGLDAEAAGYAAQDYAMVRRSLGPCDATTPAAP